MLISNIDDLERALLDTYGAGRQPLREDDYQARQDRSNRPNDVHDLEEGMQKDARSQIARLSPREHSVLKLLTSGYDIKGTARHLALNSRTVEVYRTKALEKLGAKSELELVWFGIYAGLNSKP